MFCPEMEPLACVMNFVPSVMRMPHSGVEEMGKSGAKAAVTVYAAPTEPMRASLAFASQSPALRRGLRRTPRLVCDDGMASAWSALLEGPRELRTKRFFRSSVHDK